VIAYLLSSLFRILSGMPSPSLQAIRAHRNSRLYRSLTRTLREYNRRLL